MLIRGVACDRCKKVILVKGSEPLESLFRVRVTCSTSDESPEKNVICASCREEHVKFMKYHPHA